MKYDRNMTQSRRTIYTVNLINVIEDANSENELNHNEYDEQNKSRDKYKYK